MEKSVFKRTCALLLALALCFTMAPMSVYADDDPVPEVQSEETQEGVLETTALVANIEKYGNVVLDTSLDDLTKAGFEYGDVVTVKFLEQSVDLPFCSNYSDVDQGSVGMFADGTKVRLAINMGNFATTYGIANKVTHEDNSFTWEAMEGVTDGTVSIEISMKEKAGYLDEYTMRQLKYTDAREDYPDLTDAEFANFREVTTTGMGKGILYRTASPVDPEHNRSTIADNLIKEAGVSVIMNLADSESELTSYEGFGDSYYSTTSYICLDMGVDFAAEEFEQKLARGMKFFAENPGTYAIHCKEGKDRAGFVTAVTECFMGATYEEVTADYMTTFYNYYGVKPDEERYNVICNGNIVRSLAKAFDVEDLSTADLQAEATEYLKKIGLTDDEIAALKTNLAADRPPVTQPMTVEDPYARISMIEAYEAGALGLHDVDASQPKFGNGLLLTGTVGELKKKIALDAELDLTGGRVGRIVFDGLADKGINVNVNVYIDGEETPAAVFSLKSQMGKKEWANVGDRTVDVYDKDLKGKHKVSFNFEITKRTTGEALADDKEVSVLIRSIEFAESSIPVMYFNIDESLGSISAMNSSEDHSVECYGTVDIQVPDDFVSEYNGEVMEDKTGLVLEYIRGRGNSTWGNDKKPYKVKFDKKQDLFGMGENKHWILLANRYDNSLIRNRMTYWLGDQFGLEFTPQCIPVEVVMNGEYYGSYLLCEQIRVDKNRVNIQDLEKEKYQDATDLPTISGGYLLSMSPYGDEDPANIFQTMRDVSMFLESPSFEDYDNDVQRQYIIGYVQATEDAIFGNDFKDADGNKYTEYLDLESAAKYWWVQEFSANGDAYGSGSTYLYKKEDGKNGEKGKLYWGPLWDFDYVAWGDLDYDLSIPDTLDCTDMEWFRQMKADPEFTAKLMEEWEKLDVILTDITKEGGLLDQYYEQTKTSWKYDHEKYGAYGEGGWGDYYGGEEPETNDTVRTYKEEVDQLRAWIDGRHQVAIDNLGTLSPTPHTLTFMIDGEVISTQTVLEGFPLMTIPPAPEKKGYILVGWLSQEGMIVTKGDYIYDDMILEPYYMRESDVVKPEALYFGQYDVYIYQWEGYSEEYYPSYTVVPEYADIQAVDWTSSDPSVAYVDEYGMVTCLSFGDAVITGTVGKVSNSYTIHVLSYEDIEFNEPGYINVDNYDMTLTVGDTKQVVATLEPQPCYISNLTWFSIDPDIAYVDNNGVIMAYAPGKTTLIVMNPEYGMFEKVKVTVKGIGQPKVTATPNVSKKQVKLSWKAVKGAVKYKIAYRKAGAKKWTYKTTTKKNYTIKNLAKDGVYEFKVRTIAKYANSKWSAISRIYMNKMTAKVKAGKKSVTVSWKKNTKASKYQIVWSYNSNMSKTKTINVAKSKTKYTIKNLKKGKKVYVKIRAIRTYKGKTYYGVYSAKKSVKTL
ncbi:MAG: CotH kinase family protein [Clostridiales bacterium]|nr:CotH kinase family protein [Clostridiales bacterium]